MNPKRGTLNDPMSPDQQDQAEWKDLNRVGDYHFDEIMMEQAAERAELTEVDVSNLSLRDLLRSITAEQRLFIGSLSLEQYGIWYRDMESQLAVLKANKFTKF